MSVGNFSLRLKFIGIDSHIHYIYRMNYMYKITCTFTKHVGLNARA